MLRLCQGTAEVGESPGIAQVAVADAPLLTAESARKVLCQGQDIPGAQHHPCSYLWSTVSNYQNVGKYQIQRIAIYPLIYCESPMQENKRLYTLCKPMLLHALEKKNSPSIVFPIVSEITVKKVFHILTFPSRDSFIFPFSQLREH